MVHLVLFLQPPQDRDRILDRRLGHEDGLEPAGEGRVLLHVLAVFIEGGGADAVQLAPGQSGLQQVRGVHRPFPLSGADEGVHLVDEQDDLAFRRRGLVEHGLQPLLELAAVLRPGDQRAHVEGEEALVLQAFRHVAIDDAEGQPLHNGGLADAGLADQDGIVLGPARQHLDRAADLLVPTDDGIELAVPRRLGQVAGVALEGVIAFLGPGGICRAALAQIGDRRLQRLGRHAAALQSVGRRRAVLGQGDQQALGGDKGIACGFRLAFSGCEHPGHGGGHVELAGAAFDLGKLGDRLIVARGDVVGATAGGGDQGAAETHRFGAVPLVEQGLQNVFRRKLLVPAGERQRLSGLDRLLGAIGIDVDVHDVPWTGGRFRPPCRSTALRCPGDGCCELATQGVAADQNLDRRSFPAISYSAGSAASSTGRLRGRPRGRLAGSPASSAKTGASASASVTGTGTGDSGV